MKDERYEPYRYTIGEPNTKHSGEALDGRYHCTDRYSPFGRDAEVVEEYDYPEFSTHLVIFSYSQMGDYGWYTQYGLIDESDICPQKVSFELDTIKDARCDIFNYMFGEYFCFNPD